MNLERCWPANDPPVESLTMADLSAAIEGVDEMAQPSSRRCDAICLPILPGEDATPELGHSFTHPHADGRSSEVF